MRKMSGTHWVLRADEAKLVRDYIAHGGWLQAAASPRRRLSRIPYMPYNSPDPAAIRASQRRYRLCPWKVEAYFSRTTTTWLVLSVPAGPMARHTTCSDTARTPKIGAASSEKSR